MKNNTDDVDYFRKSIKLIDSTGFGGCTCFKGLTAWQTQGSGIIVLSCLLKEKIARLAAFTVPLTTPYSGCVLFFGIIKKLYALL